MKLFMAHSVSDDDSYLSKGWQLVTSIVAWAHDAVCQMMSLSLRSYHAGDLLFCAPRHFMTTAYAFVEQHFGKAKQHHVLFHRDHLLGRPSRYVTRRCLITVLFEGFPRQVLQYMDSSEHTVIRSLLCSTLLLLLMRLASSSSHANRRRARQSYEMRPQISDDASELHAGRDGGPQAILTECDVCEVPINRPIRCQKCRFKLCVRCYEESCPLGGVHGRYDPPRPPIPFRDSHAPLSAESHDGNRYELCASILRFRRVWRQGHVDRGSRVASETSLQKSRYVTMPVACYRHGLPQPSDVKWRISCSILQHSEPFMRRYSATFPSTAASLMFAKLDEEKSPTSDVTVAEGLDGEKMTGSPQYWPRSPLPRLTCSCCTALREIIWCLWCELPLCVPCYSGCRCSQGNGRQTHEDVDDEYLFSQQADDSVEDSVWSCRLVKGYAYMILDSKLLTLAIAFATIVRKADGRELQVMAQKEVTTIETDKDQKFRWLCTVLAVLIATFWLGCRCGSWCGAPGKKAKKLRSVRIQSQTTYASVRGNAQGRFHYLAELETGAWSD